MHLISHISVQAYVQQLESCRLKLKQLEQELDSVRQQGLYNGGEFGSNNLASAGSVSSGMLVSFRCLFAVTYYSVKCGYSVMKLISSLFYLSYRNKYF